MIILYRIDTTTPKPTRKKTGGQSTTARQPSTIGRTRPADSPQNPNNSATNVADYRMDPLYIDKQEYVRRNKESIRYIAGKECFNTIEYPPGEQNHDYELIFDDGKWLMCPIWRTHT